MSATPETCLDPTTLLKSSLGGDVAATRRLLPHIYTELRRVAHRHRARERSDLTISTTGLVHEAYLKLAGSEELTWRDRRHFIALASRAVRQILTDYARARHRRKRGGGAEHVSLDSAIVAEAMRGEHLLALDEALLALEAYDARLARLVELRFFGGLSMQEAAEEMDFALRSAERGWTRARAFLLAHLSGEIG